MYTVKFEKYWKANKATIVKNWNTDTYFRHEKYEDDVRKYINSILEHIKNNMNLSEHQEYMAREELNNLCV